MKRLLDAATPLPWKVRRSIHGPKYRYVQIGKDDSYTTLDLEPTDAHLIVHAVNRLPDYERAVGALQAVVGWYENGNFTLEQQEAAFDMALVALRRLGLRGGA